MTLSREAQSLVDAARREQRGPTEAQRTRWRRGVMAAIGTGTVTSATATSAAAATAVTAKLGLAAKIGIGVVAVALAGGGAAVLRTTSESAEPTPPRSAPATPAPQPSAPSPALPPPIATATPAPTAEPSSPAAPSVSAESARPPAPRPSAPEPAAIPSKNDLAEETRLLGEAQAALGAGRPTDALAALDAHAAQFPQGALALERRALRAMALCASGRATEGRSEAQVIEARMPGSPLAKRVAEACR